MSHTPTMIRPSSVALLVLLASSCTPTTPAVQPAKEAPQPAVEPPQEAPQPAAEPPVDDCDPLPKEGTPCRLGLCPVNSDQYLECTDGTWHLITEFPARDDRP